jgi:hypothetical protein
MKIIEQYLQELDVDLKIGDMILVGKWKNKRAIVQGFAKNEKGQIVVQTDKGVFPLFKFYVNKTLPEDRRRKNHLEEE